MTAEPVRAPASVPRWWDLGAVGVPVVVAVVVGLSGAGTGTAIVVADLAVFVACWFAFGRRTLGAGRGWQAFGAVVAAVCLVGALVNPSFAVFQGLAFPLVWTIADGTRSAVVLNVLVALAIGAGYAISTGDPVQAVVVELLSLGLSLALGFWITQIEGLSAQRRALIEELTAAQEQVAALSRETGAGLERERIARDIHDTVAQSLTAIVMLAERARARHPADDGLAVLEEAARDALGETRALVTATAAVPLTGGLGRAIGDLAARFERETGLRVRVDVTAEVPRPLEVVLLRCAQEGLANVRKHSGAASASVRIDRVQRRVRLTVQDDGRGIVGDPAGAGFGLTGMRERVALVDGALTVRAVRPHGTELVVDVPAGDAR